MSEAHVSAQQSAPRQAARLPAPNGDPGRAGDLEGPPPEGPSPSLGLIWRVRGQARFAALRKAPRARSGPLTLRWSRSNAAPFPAIAFAISRKVGSATVRNQLRRRLRDSARRLDPPLMPGDYLLSASPEAADSPYGQLDGHLRHAVDALRETSASRRGPAGSTSSVGRRP
jgi:ribonuclease P protein component